MAINVDWVEEGDGGGVHHMGAFGGDAMAVAAQEGPLLKWDKDDRMGQSSKGTFMASKAKEN